MRITKRDQAIAGLIFSVVAAFMGLIGCIYIYSEIKPFSSGIADLSLIVGVGALFWGLMTGFLVRSAIETLRKS